VNHYVSIARYLLIGHFHHSIDQRIVQGDRADSLSCVKEILTCIDLTYAEFVAQQVKEKEKEKEKEKDKEKDKDTDKEKIRKQVSKDKHRHTEGERRKEQNSETPAGPTNGATNSATKKTTMGLLSSKPTDSVIEILDDTPPSTPTRRENNEKEPISRRTSQEQKAVCSDKISSNNNNNNDDDDNNNIERVRRSSNGLPLPPPANEKLPPLPVGAFAVSQSETPAQPTRTATPPPKPKPILPPKSPPRRLRLPLNERTISTKVINLLTDKPTYPNKNQPNFSASLRPRLACTVNINVGFDKPPHTTTTLDGPHVDDFHRRLERWEPYWKLVHDCTMKIVRSPSGVQYEVGCKTTRVNRCTGSSTNEAPISATQLKFAIPSEVLHDGPPLDWGKFRAYPGKLSYKHGERRLLLRTIPLNVPQKYKKKKSDTHLWPKGCFVQLNSTPLLIAQRKQQSHDHLLWKGMCHALDLTQFVARPTLLNELCICTRDEGEYAIQVAILEYIAPDALHDLCMDITTSPPKSNDTDANYNKVKIQKMTKDEGLAVAMDYLKKDAVVLDDDDDDGHLKDAGKATSTTTTTPADITLTFSLCCSMSMTAMSTPVRGKNCRHMQCFDLRNYLHTNATVSGGRWRCAVCEDFVPVQDLIVDGMMVGMLEEIGKDQISGSRDKIQMSKDGSWKFMEENRLRYSKKRPAAGGGDGAEEEDNRNRKKPANGLNRQASEIIELV